MSNCYFSYQKKETSCSFEKKCLQDNLYRFDDLVTRVQRTIWNRGSWWYIATATSSQNKDACWHQSIRDLWWKEGSVRAVFWLVLVLLCKHLGAGERKGQDQESGKTGEFWREMRAWEGCPWEEALERDAQRGEFWGICSTKGWYHHLFHLPRETSLKSPSFINTLGSLWWQRKSRGGVRRPHGILATKPIGLRRESGERNVERVKI